MASTLTLSVRIASKDLDLLQRGQHNLCLTRNVQSGAGELKGNVVFSMIPYTKLATNVTLKWSEEYQVFASHEFKNGAQVTVASDPKSIKGGQTARIDKAGTITVNGPQKPGEQFSVQNEWKTDANIGVNNKDVVSGTFATIYVSLPTLLHEMTDLLPIQTYSVFWDRELVTNTMFEHSHTPPFDFDLTGQTSISLKYEGNEWSME